MQAAVSATWIVLGVAGYGLLHSLLAAHRVKALAERLGTWAGRWYRLGFNLVALLGLLPLLALTFWLPGEVLYRIPWPWLFLSLSLQGLALAALTRSVLQTGAWDFLGIAQVLGWQRTGSGLLQGGLYRYVRHPLYTATLALLWASPIMTTNLLALFGSLTVYLWIGMQFEEQKLRTEFGSAYERYQQTTPQIIPRISFTRQRDQDGAGT